MIFLKVKLKGLTSLTSSTIITRFTVYTSFSSFTSFASFTRCTGPHKNPRTSKDMSECALTSLATIFYVNCAELNDLIWETLTTTKIERMILDVLCIFKCAKCCKVESLDWCASVHYARAHSSLTNPI